MDSKKVNIFSLIMVMVMCVFSIYVGISNNKGENGKNGKSAYETAVEYGFSGTEYEYLQSLYGSDGQDVTVEDLYNKYLELTNKTSDDVTMLQFIENYFDNIILDEQENLTLTEATTQIALRSTVDICYADYMKNPIIAVEESGDKYVINEQYNEKYTYPCVSAGSGVIYKVNSDTAYIITNYHVLYVEYYSNDEDYRVYQDVSTGNSFTGLYDASMIKEGTKTVGGGIFGGYTTTYKYINKSDVVKAPIETHFLESYDVYLYGYQSEEYALTATFVGGSADNDIAVLKIDKNNSNINNKILFDNTAYKAAEIGDSSKLNTGRTVVAVGNPLLPDTTEMKDSTTAKDYVEELGQRYIDALCLSSTSGEISVLSENVKFQSLINTSEYVDMRLIRVSSAINAGNSGGGLYDVSGKLVGIVNGKIVSEEYDNVGYAIPINVASRIADRVISGCEGISGETQAKIVTSKSLGITINEGSNMNSEFNIVWNLTNNINIETISAITKPYTYATSSSELKIGDIIKSIKVGESTKVYELNHDYDFNDILLLIDKNNTDTHTLELKILRLGDTNDFEETTITLTIQDSAFGYIN